MERLSHKEATIKVCSLVDTYFTLKDVRYKNVRKSTTLRTALKSSYLVLYIVRKTIIPFNERSLFNVHLYELTLVDNKKKLPSMKG